MDVLVYEIHGADGGMRVVTPKGSRPLTPLSGPGPGRAVSSHPPRESRQPDPTASRRAAGEAA